MPPCTARTGEPAAAPISMPLRWIEVPKEPVVERPKRVSSGPASGQGRSPWKGRSGRSIAGAPLESGDRRLQALPRLIELADELRGQLTAAIQVVEHPAAFGDRLGGRGLEVRGLSAQARDLSLLRLQLGARRLVLRRAGGDVR